MPELPEAEVVRGGMQRHFADFEIAGVDVLADRSIRDHVGGADEFRAGLLGSRFASFERRGKFMWAPLVGPPSANDGRALVVHLGMSGQVLAERRGHQHPRHTRVVLRLARGRAQKDFLFVDQRMFGRMFIDTLADGHSRLVPSTAVHIAADPFEPAFDITSVVTRIKSRTASIKSVLLNQQIVSGIGNIYADEALWRARIDWATPASHVPTAKICELLGCATEVMREALAAGGTSFDSMYVNVNGSSGYFARNLDAYGREGEPCHRCGGRITREKFDNRSAFRCPKCQRRRRTSG